MIKMLMIRFKMLIKDLYYLPTRRDVYKNCLVFCLGLLLPQLRQNVLTSRHYRNAYPKRDLTFISNLKCPWKRKRLSLFTLFTGKILQYIHVGLSALSLHVVQRNVKGTANNQRSPNVYFRFL